VHPVVKAFCFLEEVFHAKKKEFEGNKSTGIYFENM
jgi:hypothetical protein